MATDRAAKRRLLQLPWVRSFGTATRSVNLSQFKLLLFSKSADKYITKLYDSLI